MTEPNKMKWLGIRPVEPPESIPVYFKHVQDQYIQALQNLNCAAGNNDLNSTTVPAGELWVIEAICCYNTVSTVTRIQLRLKDATHTNEIFIKKGPLSWEALNYSGKLTLHEASYIQARFVGCILNDDIYMKISGYKLHQ